MVSRDPDAIIQVASDGPKDKPSEGLSSTTEVVKTPEQEKAELDKKKAKEDAEVKAKSAGGRTEVAEGADELAADAAIFYEDLDSYYLEEVGEQPTRNHEKDFAVLMTVVAKKIESKEGIPWQWIVGQALLESNNGTSTLALMSFNCFGMKAFDNYSGESVQTVEGGSKWRAYSGISASVEDYVTNLKGPNYAEAFKYKTDPRKFMEEVAKVYCPKSKEHPENPEYVKSVEARLKSFGIELPESSTQGKESKVAEKLKDEVEKPWYSSITETASGLFAGLGSYFETMPDIFNAKLTELELSNVDEKGNKNMLTTLFNYLQAAGAALFGSRDGAGSGSAPETLLETSPNPHVDTKELLVENAPYFSFPKVWAGASIAPRVTDIPRIRLEHPKTHKKNVPHKGIDIAVPEGTPIVATRPGVVIDSPRSQDETNGYKVTVRFNDGQVGSYVHLMESGLPVNTDVQPGDIIGLVGNTGISTGPHLHFQPQSGNPVEMLDPILQAACGQKIAALESAGKYKTLA